jgi:hypothetical protein
VIRRNEMTLSFVCPNTKNCEMYKLNYTYEKGKYRGDKAKIDTIRDDSMRYFCLELEKFNLSSTTKKREKIEQLPAKCALIELLNNSKRL